MKTIKKIICILCALTMVAMAFSSCNTQEEDAEPIVLSRDTLSDYVIVYGEDAGDELKEKVGEFAIKLKDKFGVAITAKDDFFKEGVDALAIKETEILIGVTNREESKSFIESLKSRDYGWKAVNKKLVIGGVNDEMTVTAIDEFISKVLSTDVAEGAFYTNDSDYTFVGEYELETITVGGKDIKEFTVAYNDDVYGMQYLAEFIRDAIADKCGRYLSVVKADEAQGLTITVDITDTDENSLLCEMLSNGNITVGGSSSQAVYKTALALSSRITALSEPALDVSITGAFVDEELTVLNWNVQGQDGNKIGGVTADRYEAVFVEYKPDILLLQEADLKNVGPGMLEVLGSEYELATTFREDISIPHTVHNIVYYKKATIKHNQSTYFWHSETPDVLSQFEGGGYVKLTEFSSLEQISSGKKILAVCVHLNLLAKDAENITGAQLRTKEINLILERVNAYLADEPTTTVIMGGDFNCVYTESTIKTLINAGYTNSSTAAEVIEAANTFPGHSHVIDYIFVSDRGALMSYYKVDDLKDENPSDHNPVIVRLCLTPELQK